MNRTSCIGAAAAFGSLPWRVCDQQQMRGRGITQHCGAIAVVIIDSRRDALQRR